MKDIQPVVVLPAASLSELDMQEKVTDHTADMGAASVEIMPENKHRTGAWLVNDSDVVIYLAIARPAVANTGIRLNAAGGAWEITKDNLVKGAINGIAASGSSKTLCAVEIETRYAYI